MSAVLCTASCIQSEKRMNPLKGVSAAHKGRGGAPEIAAVEHQIEEPGEPFEALHVRKRDVPSGGRRRGRIPVDHFECRRVSVDGGSPQALQDTHLDFVHAGGEQAVEAVGKAGHGFAGQAGDEIAVDVHTGCGNQPLEVPQGAVHVLFSSHAGCHFRVKGLRRLRVARRRTGTLPADRTVDRSGDRGRFRNAQKVFDIPVEKKRRMRSAFPAWMGCGR